MRLVAWGTPGSSATRKQWGPVLSLATADIWAGESGVEPVLGTAGHRAAALVSACWMPQTPAPGVAAKMLQTSPSVSWGTKLPPVEKGWHRIKSLRRYDEVTEQSRQTTNCFKLIREKCSFAPSDTGLHGQGTSP